jgi:template-activating factor I
MPPKGTKRASPGAEEEKNPLQNVELSDEDSKKLQTVQRDIARAELVLERQAQLKLIPVYQKRREVVCTIEKFWPVALMNNAVIAFHAQHSADQRALSFLEDLWVERDKQEPRCYTIEFYFKENPFFTDKVLKKEYKFAPLPEAANQSPDEDGITPSMLDFSWEHNVKSSSIKINWKDGEKALTKLYPRTPSDEEDELPAEPGSFFNFFESDTDDTEVGVAIGNEVFPDAIDYFLGVAADDLDSEDEDEDDDDDDAEEIDLEKPRSKKRRV